MAAVLGSCFVLSTPAAAQFSVVCGDVDGLIEAIELANGLSSATIELGENCAYVLTEEYSSDDLGASGLPPVSGNVTILGNNSAIVRSDGVESSSAGASGVRRGMPVLQAGWATTLRSRLSELFEAPGRHRVEAALEGASSRLAGIEALRSRIRGLESPGSNLLQPRLNGDPFRIFTIFPGGELSLHDTVVAFGEEEVGGCILNVQGTLSLHSSIVLSCRALFGGGIFQTSSPDFVGASSSGALEPSLAWRLSHGSATSTLFGSVMLGNEAIFAGGGVASDAAFARFDEETVFVANCAGVMGGGVASVLGETVFGPGSILLQNVALPEELWGVDSCIDELVLTLGVSEVAASMAQIGARQDSLFLPFLGGAVFNQEGLLTVAGTEEAPAVFVANLGLLGGGAVANLTGEAQIETSIFVGNAGLLAGGGLLNSAGVLDLGEPGPELVELSRRSARQRAGSFAWRFSPSSSALGAQGALTGAQLAFDAGLMEIRGESILVGNLAIFAGGGVFNGVPPELPFEILPFAAVGTAFRGSVWHGPSPRPGVSARQEVGGTALRLLVEDAIIVGNETLLAGGAVFNGGVPELPLIAGASLFAAQNGGVSAFTEIDRSILAGNVAFAGLGGAVFSGVLDFEGLETFGGTLRGGSIGTAGDHLQVVETGLEIRGSIVVGNEAIVGGAVAAGDVGVLIEVSPAASAFSLSQRQHGAPGGTARFETSAFIGNFAELEGGGLWLGEVSAEIVNSTISLNEVGTDSSVPVGAGVSAVDSELLMVHATVFRNGLGLFELDVASLSEEEATAPWSLLGAGSTPSQRAMRRSRPGLQPRQNGGEAAGLALLGGTATLRNNLFGFNEDVDCSVGGGGSLTAEGENLDSDGTCDGFTLQGLDPVLDPNPDFHFPGTTPTHLPLAGSPAIGAADPIFCEERDQRGVLRPTTQPCTLGAHEVLEARVSVLEIPTLGWWGRAVMMLLLAGVALALARRAATAA